MKKLISQADRLEDSLLALLFRIRLPLFLICVTAMGFWARTFFWSYTSLDFTTYLNEWLNEIRTLHGFHSLGTQIGNYSAPYHYLLAAFTYIPSLDNLAVIKITSAIADFVMASALGLVAWRFTGKAWKGILAYVIVLCLPTVFLNSAAWGQCDAMYTAVVLFALYFWFSDKKAISLALYGCALAIKLQAIYILPAFVIFWLCGRLRLRHFLAALGSYILVMLPAVIASGDIGRFVSAYKSQITDFPGMALNINNGANLFSGFTMEEMQAYNPAFIVFTFIAIGIVAFYCWQKRFLFTRETEFLLFFLMAGLVPFLLPAGHERYLYMAEVLCLVYVLCWPRRFVLSLCLQLAVVPRYMQYLTGLPNPFGEWLMVVMAIPLLYAMWDIYSHFLRRAQTLLKLNHPQAAELLP